MALQRLKCNPSAVPAPLPRHDLEAFDWILTCVLVVSEAVRIPLVDDRLKGLIDAFALKLEI